VALLALSVRLSLAVRLLAGVEVLPPEEDDEDDLMVSFLLPPPRLLPGWMLLQLPPMDESVNAGWHKRPVHLPRHVPSDPISMGMA